MVTANGTLIIIPAYNEEKSISAVISAIRNFSADFNILVVNDASTDRTAQLAMAAGARLLNLPFNMGYGVALQTGFKYAIRNNYEYAVQMDADGQHEPRFIERLLEVVVKGEADIAIGSRFLEGSYQAQFVRRMGMLLFGSLASVIIRQRVTDPTSGFQALNRKVMEFYASDYYPVDFPDADVIIMLHRAGLKIKEIPVKMYPNAEKKSMHSGLKPIYYIFKMFLSILVTLLRK
jgi:glycosyltransferase involved in cell wall biosynthesis